MSVYQLLNNRQVKPGSTSCTTARSTRRHLTQLQLAKDMGVHRHAIGRWEQGDGLPAKKAIVLELARHLCLDDAEARQLLEASFTALPPPFVIPC